MAGQPGSGPDGPPEANIGAGDELGSSGASQSGGADNDRYASRAGRKSRRQLRRHRAEPSRDPRISTPLKELSVAPTRREAYLKELGRFVRWTSQLETPMQKNTEEDLALHQYMS